MEKRKIERLTNTGNCLKNSYEVLKPSNFGEEGEWEHHGRRYGIRGLFNLIRQQEFEFDFLRSKEVSDDLEKYKSHVRNRKNLWKRQYWKYRD